VLSDASVRKLVMWAQAGALSYELTSDGPRVGTVSMGQELCAGRPVASSTIFLAQVPRDDAYEVLLSQMDVSATPDPRPGQPDRRILTVAIVSHRLCMLVFIADSPGPVGPPLSALQWSPLWPSVGSIEYPPRRYMTRPELWRLFTEPGRWIPAVQVPVRRVSAG